MSRKDARPAENRPVAILLILLAGLIFAVSDLFAKLVLVELPPMQVFWLRCTVALAVTLALAYARLGRQALATAHPGMQFLRGLFALGASYLFLNGLAHLPLADNTAINFAWPILVTMLSIPILGEKVGLRRWLATLVGFIGMLLIIRPGSGTFQLAALYPLGGAAAWAMAVVMTRKMMATEAPETTLACSALIFFLGSSLLVPFFWQPLTGPQIALCALIGLFSAAGHAAAVFAFERARASSIAPFGYAQIVWASLIGVFYLGTLPDQWVIAGAVLIVIAGIYTAHRERVRAGAAS